MGQQWAGVLASHAGATQTTTVAVSAPMMKANAFVWTHGAFGVSVTRSVAGATFGVAVWSNIAGVSIKLAEVTGLMGLSTATLPFVNEATIGAGAVLGSTQSSAIGILAPKTVTLTGVSAGIGITFGCVVTGALFRA